MGGWVYVMASSRNGTLYIGVTSDLSQRVHVHKCGSTAGFTKRYDVTQLVWYEAFDKMPDAIAAEKRMKRWPRQWKLNVIESMNPQWRDLYADLNA